MRGKLQSPCLQVSPCQCTRCIEGMPHCGLYVTQTAHLCCVVSVPADDVGPAVVVPAADITPAILDCIILARILALPCRLPSLEVFLLPPCQALALAAAVVPAQLRHVPAAVVQPAARRRAPIVRSGARRCVAVPGQMVFNLCACIPRGKM